MSIDSKLKSITENNYDTPKSSFQLLISKKLSERKIPRASSMKINSLSSFSSLDAPANFNLKTYDPEVDNSQTKQIKIDYEEDEEDNNFARPSLKAVPKMQPVRPPQKGHLYDVKPQWESINKQNS
eukprot:CAMPEP_0168321120 /NCGR_PEP_ID=MMETSP0213-20121227/2082_1 /TAXON_ID=151035 /ORGANISM="Euplotes harpa, Strain FSP1.4" /LENGTH=125 /DNA_ID=CAMNT_0008322711 /DNA_START=1129 /DNA_END=1503 /DNA_ORIENTATION=+